MDSMQKDTLTQAVLILEFGVIVVLVWGVSLEYRANQYLQAWVNERAPLLGYLLNGYLAAMLGGVLVGSIILFLQNRPRRIKPESPKNV